MYGRKICKFWEDLSIKPNARKEYKMDKKSVEKIIDNLLQSCWERGVVQESAIGYCPYCKNLLSITKLRKRYKVEKAVWGIGFAKICPKKKLKRH